MSVRYLVVTPAKDEAASIAEMAASLESQTLPYDAWVVVDDGSTDGTPDIARSLLPAHGRARLLELRVPRERRDSGGIAATLAGLASVGDLFSYDYIANVDADIVLPRHYFERLFTEFEADPDLGIAGGHCWVRRGGRLVLDNVPDDHVHGAVKVYRAACLRDVWPLMDVCGWDTIDEYRAQMRGWRTRSFHAAAVVHTKPMFGGLGRPLAGSFALGKASHFVGYRTDYLLLRAVRNLAKPPLLLGGVAMACGFAYASFSGRPRIDDADLIRFVRNRQAARLRGVLSPAAGTRGAGR